MRRFNAVLSAVILMLFLLHGILGAFQMIGAGNTTVKIISWTMTGLILIHVIIGVKLTADSVKVWKRTGAGYFKENTLFWARRISGFAVMVLLFFHVTAYSTAGEVLRLKQFTSFKLVTQLLLVAAIAVHVITNVKPMLISFGIKRLRPRAKDVLFVISVLLLFMTIAIAVYYIRWNFV